MIEVNIVVHLLIVVLQISISQILRSIYLHRMAITALLEKATSQDPRVLSGFHWQYKTGVTAGY